MPLSSEAQSLFDHARNSLPRWLTGAASSVLEWLYGFTEIFDEVRAQGQDWLDISYILNATGVELDQHAADRGTSRRAGESDATLQQRLRSVEDSVTEPTLWDSVDKILDHTHQAYLQVQDYTVSGWNTLLYVADSYVAGNGGPFSTLTMVDDNTNPATLVETPDLSIQPLGTMIHSVVHYKSGTTTRAQFEALFSTSQVFYVGTASASGGTALTAGDAFTIKRAHLAGMVALRRDRGHFQIPTKGHAFMSRGYRMTNANRPMAYIFICPYGTTAAEANAIREYLRQNGPAGYLYYIEIRANIALV